MCSGKIFSSVICFIYFFLILSCVARKSNRKCHRSDRREHCPKLPEKDCQPVQRPCSYCFACARNLGDRCSRFTPRCADGLMCVNKKGRALEIVPWYLDKFKGFCQVVIFEVHKKHVFVMPLGFHRPQENLADEQLAPINDFLARIKESFSWKR